ncbi:enoyl-CoA hydratase-related protein [Paraburkholderia acidicola]|uniref:Enoyl-CoA hydratase-related protein n=1 Tax=Paraburkholderia acidicola TaxID=1912599 RepID=A0ABV1LJM0_9BURK
MNYKTITLTIDGSVAELRLNRPETLNSLSLQMFDEIGDALHGLSSDERIRALLVTAEGRAFCTGGDLADIAGITGRSGEQSFADRLGEGMAKHVNPVVSTLMGLPIPVVCAVNGIAAGGGFSFVLGCDIVVAARSARFIQSFAKVGLIPDMGGTWLLPQIVGRPRALALSLLADGIDAETAQAWGLIWQCVDDAALDDTARALSRRLAALPTRTLGLTKQAINTSGTRTLDEQLEVERELQVRSAASDDCREGIDAFLHRRAPVFVGH